MLNTNETKVSREAAPVRRRWRRGLCKKRAASGPFDRARESWTRTLHYRMSIGINGASATRGPGARHDLHFHSREELASFSLFAFILAVAFAISRRSSARGSSVTRSPPWLVLATVLGTFRRLPGYTHALCVFCGRILFFALDADRAQ